MNSKVEATTIKRKSSHRSVYSCVLMALNWRVNRIDLVQVIMQPVIDKYSFFQRLANIVVSPTR